MLEFQAQFEIFQSKSSGEKHIKIVDRLYFSIHYTSSSKTWRH